MAEQFLDYDKALTCIHCGLCLAHCPTYLETGNENDSPRGRIYTMRAIQNDRLKLDATTVKHLDLCLGCRACEAVCPSGVHYGKLLETTREHIEKNYRRSVFQTFLRKIFIEQVFPYPWRTTMAIAPVKLLRALGLGALLPEIAAFVPQEARSVKLPEVSPATAPKRGRVGLITGCVQSVMFGETNAATVKLLNRAGYDVVTPREQVCCGALYAHSGNLASAREVARQNIKVFERAEVDLIVINAAGCGSTLKEYGHLVGTDAGVKFAAKVKDLSEVLLPRQGKCATRVTFHDACHLAHAQRITAQPRALVKAIAGDQYVELPEAAICCGSAGSYNLTEPGMAGQLQRRKVENILKTEALTVVTTNPGCILQIRAGLKKAGALDVRVVHLADFLAETIRA
ncbi:MAG: Lactate utilization protein A [Verrucomicrobiae bacterium]|nr:Lactate utilization protein A [Verrucomicrobiae bacterium]